jgi:diketogulonate reductase-like aldo/keto reductase
LGIDYADTILFHTPRASKIPLEDSYNELQRFVTIGKSEHMLIIKFNKNI